MVVDCFLYVDAHLLRPVVVDDGKGDGFDVAYGRDSAITRRGSLRLNGTRIALLAVSMLTNPRGRSWAAKLVSPVSEGRGRSKTSRTGLVLARSENPVVLEVCDTCRYLRAEHAVVY